MAARKSGWNREDIKDKYPQLTKTLDNIFNSAKTKYGQQKANFGGKFEGKRLSFAKMEEILEENGYIISIVIDKK